MKHEAVQPSGNDLLEMAQVAIAAAAPNNDNDRVEIKQQGQDSLVAIVDGSLVFKFPRSASAVVRSEFERLVLQEIGAGTSCEIPRVLGTGLSPPWTALTWLDGEDYSYEQLRNLDERVHYEIGRGIGQFAYEMHDCLDRADLTNKRAMLFAASNDDTPWSQHFEQTVGGHTFATQAQGDVANRIYEQWRSAMHGSQSVVIHDDLHIENLRFRNQRLHGVLDFADANIGSPEQDLRHTVWMSEQVAAGAADAYEQLSGWVLNRTLIRLWSIMQELAAFCEHNAHHRSHERARSHLQRWFPTVDWTTPR